MNRLIKSKFGTKLNMLIYCFYFHLWTGICLPGGIIAWLVILNAKPISSLIQKQPPEVVYRKRCSQKFHKIYCCVRGTLLKKSPQHKCFAVNFVEFLRTPFYIEHLRLLLPYLTCLLFREVILIYMKGIKIFDKKIKVWIQNELAQNLVKQISFTG